MKMHYNRTNRIKLLFVCYHLFIMYLCTISFFLFAVTAPSFAVEVGFFSPPEDVNYPIKSQIYRSKVSIDLAIADIKSKDIAEALVDAQARGVALRIVIYSGAQKGVDSQIRYLTEKGIRLKYLEIHDANTGNFVIFDEKLLLGGTFYMSDEKYQNITFTNNPDSITQYKNRFYRLVYGARDSETPVAGNRSSSVTVHPLPLTPPTMGVEKTFPPPVPLAEGKKGGGGRSGGGAEPLPSSVAIGSMETFPPEGGRRPAVDEQANLSFEEMNKLFGRDSLLSKSEKEDRWREYRGQYVTWSGNITSVAWGIISGAIIGVMHKDNEEVTVQLEKGGGRAYVKRLHKGEPITYRGKLAKMPSRFTGFKVNDATIIK